MALEILQENIQTTVGVDPENPEMGPILRNLQGNILKAHGRDQAYHIFLRFTGESDEVKRWIRAYAEDSHRVTSALKQFEDADKRKNGNPNYSGGLLGCFFLSAAGYEFLAYSTEKFENSFRRGMKVHEEYVYNRNNKLHMIRNKDPLPKEWQKEYRDEVHAMLLLAQNCNEINPSLEDRVEQVIAGLKGIADLIIVECGRRLLNNKGQDFEHFGYRDGISNPVFFKREIEDIQKKRYNPSAPLELVCVKDPLADEDDCYGSYLVFRKLKQDVKGFEDQVAELFIKINQIADLSRPANPNKEELIGAQIVGRFKNGTPVTDYDSSHDLDDKCINDFNFKEDDGFKCPIHAHIRQTNLRDDREENRRRRIVRRGIPYGKPGDDEVGLLFMCYQRSIYDQFEFIQRVWMDNRNHPIDSAGQDPLVGQDKFADALQGWPIEWDNPEARKTPYNFGGHVSLKGGEYFFAPSLSFLKNMV